MRQKIAGMLILTMIFAFFAPLGVFADDRSVGYRIEGTYEASGGVFSVDIYIQNINAISGYFALAYDTDKLSLMNGGDIATAVKKGEGATISAAGNRLSDLISEDDGFVCFTWYPDSDRLDARSEDRLVGTVQFQLNQGVSTGDFNADTLEMQFMEEDDPLGWDSGAWIREEGLVDYKNNVDGVKNCEVAFGYPGSTVAGNKARAVELTVSGTNGSALSGAEVRIGTDKLTADSNGRVSTKLKQGNYTYKAAKVGYEEKSGSLSVGESGLKQKITLRTAKELVQDVVNGINIKYAQGDSAEHVTKAIGLPTSAQQNQVQIEWSSSYPGVINGNGSVFPASKAITVTMKAVATMGGESAVKEFTVTVDAKKPGQNTGQITSSGSGNSSSGGSTDGTEQDSGLQFNDLQNVPWAREAILILADEGIISGTGNHTFSPANSIKRGDFIALLMRMLPAGDYDENTADFADVPQSSYYYSEIKVARALGIAAGTDDNQFYPESGITREDMMALTYRALVQAGYLKAGEKTSGLSQFTDSAEVSDYAKTPAAELVAEGLIHGDGTMLHPKDNTTRAETAVFLYGIWQRFL